MNDNIEINEMCRLCLTKEEVNVDIFEGKGDEEQLDFKISTCLPIQISRNDCFPNKICSDCSDKVNSMFLFWNTSVSSEKILLDWFLQCGTSNQSTDNSDTQIIPELTSSDVKIDVKDEEITNESPEELAPSNFVADYGIIKQEIIEFPPDEKLPCITFVNALDVGASEIMDTALCRIDSPDNPLAQQNVFSHQKMKMPRRYVRKSTRQSWDDVAMQEAIKAVQEKKMGWLKAAKLYQVPQSTLRRRACNKNKHVKGVQKGLGRFSNTFDHQTEKELVEHIKFLESRLFVLTPTEVRRLVFEFAEKNKIKHRFNREKKIAGKEWLRGFRERNRDISLRLPEATSLAKARAFNKPQVSKFFEVLYSLLETQSISVDKIYNMDECDLSAAQKPPKVLGLTGEGSQRVNVICCMSATGQYIPPALIFARKDRKDKLFDKAPPGSLGLCLESGWMNSELFVKWLKHFYQHANPTPESKALLLLDGHVSHTSLEAVSFCQDNNIILICLPLHCSHRLQPLDVSFFGPLKAYYNETCSTWLKYHSGHVITAYQVGELFSEAYKKAATIHNALSGFAKAGISPFNSNIFPDHLYEPSDATNFAIERNNHLEIEDPLEEGQLDGNNLSEEDTRPEIIFKQETNEIYSDEFFKNSMCRQEKLSIQAKVNKLKTELHAIPDPFLDENNTVDNYSRTSSEWRSLPSDDETYYFPKTDGGSNSTFPNADSLSTNDAIILARSLKKGTKRKKNDKQWKKNILKESRNRGKAYEMHSMKRKIRNERKMKPTCSEKCRLKCSTKFSEEERNKFFTAYWNLADVEQQRTFILNSMNTICPKYRYVRLGGLRNQRQNNNAFYLCKHDKKVRVCKLFYKNTLDINDRPIRTVLSKINKIPGVLLEPDMRGKHGKHKKIKRISGKVSGSM